MDSSSRKDETHIAADLPPKEYRKHYEAPRFNALGRICGDTQTSIIIGVE